MAGPSFKLFTRVDGQLLELERVAICFESAADAERFAAFAKLCGERMRELGDDYSHEHLVGGGLPDVTIERLAKA